MRPKVIFLIPTHNRWPSLQKAVTSITELHGIENYQGHIFVFDNGSKQSGIIPLPQHSTLRLHLKRSETNLFMRAKYELEQWALDSISVDDDDLIIHLDDDVILSPYWLSATSAAIGSGEFDACGSVEYWEGKLVLSGQSKLDLGIRIVHGRILLVWKWHWQEISAAEERTVAVSFAGHRAIAVRSRLAKIALHDPNYLIGGEDLDYSLALREIGARLAISNRALIQHRSMDESEIPGFRTPTNVIKSWRYFFGKWGFVRENAASEAGLSADEWLGLFATESIKSMSEPT